jgi:DNA excision repair protein ERCC-4
MVKVKPTLAKDFPTLTLPPAPPGFVIIIDTKEQERGNPYFKNLPCAMRQNLKTGDYSIKGFEDKITIERKRPDDLLGCMGKERGRFTRELERMAPMFFKAIVIEGSERDLFTSIYSDMKPQSIRVTLISYEVKYGVHIYYARNREFAERWVYDRLYYFFIRVREGRIVL